MGDIYTMLHTNQHTNDKFPFHRLKKCDTPNEIYLVPIITKWTFLAYDVHIWLTARPNTYIHTYISTLRASTGEPQPIKLRTAGSFGTRTCP
jgi:hypothetical protein